MNRIQKLIKQLSNDSTNPEINFELGIEYEKIGQSSSAAFYFLRCAEHGYDTHKLIAYSALLKVANCLSSQNNRMATVKGSILQAISFIPNRPEAYFMMSKLYEQEKEWQLSYTFASIGLQHKDIYVELYSDVGYRSNCSLEFQIGVAAYWLGRKDESIDIFKELYLKDIPEEYMNSIKNNLNVLGISSTQDS